MVEMGFLKYHKMAQKSSIIFNFFKYVTDNKVVTYYHKGVVISCKRIYNISVPSEGDEKIRQNSTKEK